MAQTLELDSRIEALYDAFAGYTPTHGAHCSHCVHDSEVARLHRVPLRRLTVADLGRYPSKALTTWGTLDDFKHFLPRILELAAENWDNIVVPTMFLPKFAYGAFPTWPADERAAVGAYLEAMWGNSLSGAITAPQLADLVEWVAACGLDLLPFLTRLDEDESPSATVRLAQLVDWSCSSPARRGSGIAGEHAETSAALERWLLRPAILRRLERDLLRVTDPGALADISWAYDLLEPLADGLDRSNGKTTG